MNTNTTEVAAITDPKFFQGGNATFTVASPNGERYTYRIRKPKPEMPYFASLLTGPDNESSYTYIGVYQAQKPGLALTKKSKLTADSKPVRVFNWAVAVIAAHQQPPVGYTIQHEGKCCCCGRKLTQPKSITAGYGEECAAKLGVIW